MAVPSHVAARDGNDHQSPALHAPPSSPMPTARGLSPEPTARPLPPPHYAGPRGAGMSPSPDPYLPTEVMYATRHHHHHHGVMLEPPTMVMMPTTSQASSSAVTPGMSRSPSPGWFAYGLGAVAVPPVSTFPAFAYQRAVPVARRVHGPGSPEVGGRSSSSTLSSGSPVVVQTTDDHTMMSATAIQVAVGTGAVHHPTAADQEHLTTPVDSATMIAAAQSAVAVINALAGLVEPGLVRACPTLFVGMDTGGQPRPDDALCLAQDFTNYATQDPAWAVHVPRVTPLVCLAAASSSTRRGRSRGQGRVSAALESVADCLLSYAISPLVVCSTVSALGSLIQELEQAAYEIEPTLPRGVTDATSRFLAAQKAAVFLLASTMKKVVLSSDTAALASVASIIIEAHLTALVPFFSFATHSSGPDRSTVPARAILLDSVAHCVEVCGVDGIRAAMRESWLLTRVLHIVTSRVKSGEQTPPRAPHTKATQKKMRSEGKRQSASSEVPAWAEHAATTTVSFADTVRSASRRTFTSPVAETNTTPPLRQRTAIDRARAAAAAAAAASSSSSSSDDDDDDGHPLAAALQICALSLPLSVSHATVSWPMAEALAHLATLGDPVPPMNAFSRVVLHPPIRVEHIEPAPRRPHQVKTAGGDLRLGGIKAEVTGPVIAVVVKVLAGAAPRSVTCLRPIHGLAVVAPHSDRDASAFRRVLHQTAWMSSHATFWADPEGTSADGTTRGEVTRTLLDEFARDLPATTSKLPRRLITCEPWKSTTEPSSSGPGRRTTGTAVDNRRRGMS